MNDSGGSSLALFVRVLNATPEQAALLIEAELLTLEEIAYVPLEELQGVPGVDATQIETWRGRARHYLLSEEIRGNEDEDPVSMPVGRPPKPMAGGSAAAVDDTDG